ncbi:MAG: hypothetical protein LC722_08040 [Actinobacteria bacterium]|nr:hypothetical protein [Actinomycetota bacterium]
MQPDPGLGSPASDRPRWRIPFAVAIAVLLIAGLVALGSIRRQDRPPPLNQADQVAALIDQAASVRELAFLHPVEPTFVSAAELAADVRREAREDGTAVALPAPEVLVALGMLEPGTDLDETLTEAAAASVIGFYDPETKGLVVRSGADPLSPATQVTLVHELTHAVTDQHYDLGTLVTGDEPDDAFAARLALAEGDATFAMGEWAQEHLSLAEQLDAGFESVFQAAGAGAPGPEFLAPMSLFPYLEGMAFVTALYSEGGWDAVNRAYRNPPVSTEQIMHPDRYIAGDDGFSTVEELTARMSSATQTGQVGELFLRTMLQDGSVGDAAEAAAGWDGGAWALSASGVVTILTHWDTAEDRVGCIELRHADSLTQRMEVRPRSCV